MWASQPSDRISGEENVGIRKENHDGDWKESCWNKTSQLITYDLDSMPELTHNIGPRRLERDQRKLK